MSTRAPAVFDFLLQMEERASAYDDDVKVVICGLAMARQDAIARATESPAEEWLSDGFLPFLTDPDFAVYPQTKIGPYRVDFLCEHNKNLSRRSVVVEVDGHDWHERTKEQASRDKRRDRALTGAGLTVVRFTGSDVYHDPLKCATEVYDLTLKAQ